MKNMFKINGNPQEFADLGVFHKLSKQFLPYAQEKLGFDKPVSVNLISDPQNAKNPLGKTAYYNPGTMEVTVFVDKRHVKDILRSMSHELVHHTQNCRGEFEGGVNTGPGYAQEDGHMREMEKEAYLEGQLLLRDFEDNLKKENKMKITETTLKQLIKEQLELMEKVDELQLEEDGSVDEGHCAGDRDELEEAEIQNPGKYKTGMKAGYDKDGDGVPDGADENPKDGAIQEGEESLEEDEQNEGLGKKVGTHDGKPVRQIGSKKPADTHPAYDTPQADRARRGKGKLTVQKEDWTKKNKDQLLFERLIEKWIK